MKEIIQREVLRLESDRARTVADHLAVEEPLEIKLGFGPPARRRYQSLAVTMRTPGNDFELVLGFLYTEGIIGRREEVTQLYFAGDRLHPESRENVVVAELHPRLRVDLERLSRHFYTTSSCGVCGKASLDMVRTTCVHLLRPGEPAIDAGLLSSLPRQLAQRQTFFGQTGGMHASALFDPTGQLLLLREDVGRHNSLDKLIGAALEAGRVPLHAQVLLVSGRASFELVQKAAMAAVPVLAAVGAASSLAVGLADDHGMTLVGFLRDGQANVYCGEERLKV